MPKKITEFHHAFIHFEDKIDNTNFYAYRRLNGDDAHMAHTFTQMTARQPRLRLSGGACFLRLGCSDLGTLPEAIEPRNREIRRKARYFHLVFEHGKPPQLFVINPGSQSAVYAGPLYAYCVAHDAISNAKTQRQLLQHDAKMERQRIRRNADRDEREYLKANPARHAKRETPPEDLHLRPISKGKR